MISMGSLKRRTLFIVLCIITISFGLAFAEGRNDNVFERQYNEIVAVMEKYFYNPAKLAAVFGSAGNRFRNEVSQVRTEDEFAVFMNKVLAELRSSHTRYYTKHEPEFYQLASIFKGAPAVKKLFNQQEIRYSTAGIATRQMEGKTFIIAVLEGSPGHRAGLLRGDEIISLNDKPFVPRKILENPAGKPMTFVVRRNREGELLSFKVTPEIINPSREYLRAEQESARVITSGSNKIGYVHVWSYAGTEYQQALVRELTKGKLRDADALIWDLRDGWGGADPYYMGIFSSKVPEVKMTDRNGKSGGYGAKKGLPGVIWRKPVVMLVNGGSRSGKEILAYGFRKYKVGTIIGEKTAGMVLGGTLFVLSNNDVLYLAVADVRTDGVNLEATGVEPDIAVPMDIRYSAGKDPQLVTAVQFLDGVLRKK